MIKVKIFVVFLLFFQLNCTTSSSSENTAAAVIEAAPPADPVPVEIGAAQLTAYLPALAGKTVGLVVNHTSTVGDQHLVDILLENDINIKSIFIKFQCQSSNSRNI